MKDPWLDTWRERRIALEVRLVEPLSEGEADDLQTDDWFRGVDEHGPPEHGPSSTVDPATGNRRVQARLVGRQAVARALDHLLWAWSCGAVVSFSIESTPAGTRISIVYAPDAG